jgi:hypothetical protein
MKLSLLGAAREVTGSCSIEADMIGIVQKTLFEHGGPPTQLRTGRQSRRATKLNRPSLDV